MRTRKQMIPIYMGIAIIVLIVLAVAIGTGGGNGVSRTPSTDRSSPENVNERVVESLRDSEFESLYEDFAPSFKEVFSVESVTDAFSKENSALGRLLEVQILEEPTVLLGSEWNGEWADGRVKLIYENAEQEYITRFVLENDDWWFFGTIEP